MRNSHYRVAVYGDMGVTDVSDLNAFFVKERVHQGDIDFIMHAGDISYANGYQVHAGLGRERKKMELTQGLSQREGRRGAGGGEEVLYMQYISLTNTRNWQASWDIWFQKMELVGAYVPYMVCTCY